jgi:hypothetical protein
MGALAVAVIAVSLCSTGFLAGAPKVLLMPGATDWVVSARPGDDGTT